jgi:hypothetical protein
LANKYSPYPGDVIDAKLEPGEYVLNRNAVKAVGRDNLDELNDDIAPRFNKGGSVDWSTAPKIGSPERRAWYDKHKLKHDSTISPAPVPVSKPAPAPVSPGQAKMLEAQHMLQARQMVKFDEYKASKGIPLNLAQMIELPNIPGTVFNTEDFNKYMSQYSDLHQLGDSQNRAPWNPEYGELPGIGTEWKYKGGKMTEAEQLSHMIQLDPSKVDTTNPQIKRVLGQNPKLGLALSDWRDGLQKEADKREFASGKRDYRQGHIPAGVDRETGLEYSPYALHNADIKDELVGDPNDPSDDYGSSMEKAKIRDKARDIAYKANREKEYADPSSSTNVPRGVSTDGKTWNPIDHGERYKNRSPYEKARAGEWMEDTDWVPSLKEGMELAKDDAYNFKKFDKLEKKVNKKARRKAQWDTFKAKIGTWEDAKSVAKGAYLARKEYDKNPEAFSKTEKWYKGPKPEKKKAQTGGYMTADGKQGYFIGGLAAAAIPALVGKFAGGTQAAGTAGAAGAAGSDTLLGKASGAVTNYLGDVWETGKLAHKGLSTNIPGKDMSWGQGIGDLLQHASTAQGFSGPRAHEANKEAEKMTNIKVDDSVADETGLPPTTDAEGETTETVSKETGSATEKVDNSGNVVETPITGILNAEGEVATEIPVLTKMQQRPDVYQGSGLTAQANQQLYAQDPSMKGASPEARIKRYEELFPYQGNQSGGFIGMQRGGPVGLEGFIQQSWRNM